MSASLDHYLSGLWPLIKALVTPDQHISVSSGLKNNNLKKDNGLIDWLTIDELHILSIYCMYGNCSGEPTWHRAGVGAPLCKSTSISYLQISPQRREHIVSDTHQPSGRYATFQLTMALSKGGGDKVHHTSLTQFASLQAPASVSPTHRSLRGPQVSSTSAVLRQQMPPTGYPSCQTVGGRKQK